MSDVLNDSSAAVAFTSHVNIEVGLDAQRRPVQMHWQADDADEVGKAGPQPCKSALLSLWDPGDANTSLIHLWTTEMRIDEMHKFVHQTLTTLAESYGRATNRSDLAGAIREFSTALLEAAMQNPPEHSHNDQS